MTAIRIMKFAGEASGVTPRHIPSGYAQEAMNCDVTLGTLRGIRANDLTAESSGRWDPKTIYKYPNGKWLSWVNDVDVCRSPLADDPWSRIYWTGDGYPKMASVDNATSGTAPYPKFNYKLGVPAPDSAPVAVGAVGEEPDTVLSVVYAYSYVTSYGEEGPLSSPSGIVVRWDSGGNPSLSLSSGTVSGLNIAYLRIYRSEDGGDYNHVVDLPNGASSYVDSVPSSALGATAISITWDPPKEGMVGLTSHPGNFLIGFFDNVLCFSEPGYPHAWPIDYRIALDDDIVAVSVAATGIAVMTKGMPVLVVGSVPSAMDAVKIETYQACVSKRSVVDMGDYVLYASNDGLVSIGSQNGLITGAVMTKERWKTMNPSSIHAYRDGDRYLAFYEDVVGDKYSFAFSPQRGFEYFSDWYSAGFYDPLKDLLYLADGSALRGFDTGGRRSYYWHSGVYEVQPGSSFTCGKLVADAYPVALHVYSLGLHKFTLNIESNRMFRLPAGHWHERELSFKIESGSEVFSLQIAQSPSELI